MRMFYDQNKLIVGFPCPRAPLIRMPKRYCQLLKKHTFRGHLSSYFFVSLLLCGNKACNCVIWTEK